MKLTHWAAISILAGACLAGCQWQREFEPEVIPLPPPAIPVSDEFRERMQRAAPDALIGQVTAVNGEHNLAAVEGVPVEKIHRNDIITFYGGEGVRVGVGTVDNILDNRIVVRFDTPPAGERGPAVGDLAIRFVNR